VADIPTEAGERLQRFALADDDDFDELTVARTARPASDLEDILDDVIGDRPALKFPHGPEAAQEIGQLMWRSFDGHPNFSLAVRRAASPSLVMVSKGARLHAASSTSQKEVKKMNRMNRLIIGAGAAATLLTGGVIGAAIAGPLGASAATSSSAAATAATAASPSAGTRTFVPNEDPTHEAGESAAREAQENAGQVPTVP
jgi:hypothetical protein